MRFRSKRGRRLQRRKKLKIGVSVLSCTEGASEQPASAKLLLKCYAEEKTAFRTARKKKAPPELSVALRHKKQQRKHQMQQLDQWMASKRAVEASASKGGAARPPSKKGVLACLHQVCDALKASGRSELLQDFVAHLERFSTVHQELKGTKSKQNAAAGSLEMARGASQMADILMQARLELCTSSKMLLEDQLPPALLEEFLSLFSATEGAPQDMH
jgi:hypothetical protein